MGFVMARSLFQQTLDHLADAPQMSALLWAASLWVSSWAGGLGMLSPTYDR